MTTLVFNHLLLWSALVLLVDLLVWQLAPVQYRVAKVAIRLGLFLLYSWMIIGGGVSPLLAPPWPDDTLLQMCATALAIFWWLYLARVLTELLGLLLTHRIGHSGRLLQDVIGALVFLIAIVAAAGYVMQLPVKGLLATSGAMAIIVGLALQSTLSDVFSGIVLNTTKPYQVDDSISIDGVEGKVLDISWRATYLLTTDGSTAVVPNSVAAKAKLINLSRPSNLHGVSISLQLPNHVRPRRVLDALERSLRGTSLLLAVPAPKALVKASGETVTEYVASGFIADLAKRGDVRNQLFDLAHRHLEAAGISRLADGTAPVQGVTRARELLDEVKIFHGLSVDAKDQMAAAMVVKEFAAGQRILEVSEVSEFLMVIGTGVITAEVPDGDGFLEVGRMGPGEIMGEQSILGDTPSEARFTAMTSTLVYRIDKTLTQHCVEQSSAVGKALNKLQAVRQQTSHALLLHKPVAIRKGGFLSWLQKR
jgi:small-conductance mechanosensitive channel/CRP-like cAMP-binding protein